MNNIGLMYRVQVRNQKELRREKDNCMGQCREGEEAFKANIM